MHFAASSLALLRQRLHLHQVCSVGSKVIKSHREAFRAAHIIAVGIPLWVRAGSEAKSQDPTQKSGFLCYPTRQTLLGNCGTGVQTHQRPEREWNMHPQD